MCQLKPQHFVYFLYLVEKNEQIRNYILSVINPLISYQKLLYK